MLGPYGGWQAAAILYAAVGVCVDGGGCVSGVLGCMAPPSHVIHWWMMLVWGFHYYGPPPSQEATTSRAWVLLHPTAVQGSLDLLAG